VTISRDVDATATDVSQPPLSLSEKQKELINSTITNLALVRDAYSTVRIQATEVTFLPNVNPDSLSEEQWRKEEVRDLTLTLNGNLLYRVDGFKTTGGNKNGGAYLISDGKWWDLGLDPKTNEHLVAQHGDFDPNLKAYQLKQRWANAAYAVDFMDIAKTYQACLTPGVGPGIAMQFVSVETSVINGSTLLELQRREIIDPSSELRRPPLSGRVVLYHDQFSVLKEAVSLSSGTKFEQRTTQECEYKPFTGNIPELSRVVIFWERRDHGETEWQPAQRMEIEFETIEFGEEHFQISDYIDLNPDIEVGARASRVNWLLLANGIAFLCLWWFLHRRYQRKPAQDQ